MTPRILIVDDEKENREALKLYLQDANPGWKLYTAKGHNEGTAVIKKQLEKDEPIDLVLTDLVMSDERSGLKLLESARNLDPEIMAILFTAREQSLDRYEAFDRYGAFDVVEKNIPGRVAAREINIKARTALRYRDHTRRIAFLGRYFDPRVFDTIEKDPSVLKLSKRTISICFWDVRGFSRLCEIMKASPELIAGFLKEYGDLAQRIVFKHGGLLDKFIGDGVMALFGVLNHKDDEGKADAIAAVKAALEFRTEFESLRDDWMKQWTLYTPQSIEIGLGCGIHTGEALVGNVGTKNRDQFTALGPAVNLASRIESRSESAQVRVSQSTESRIRKEFLIDELETLRDIKNIPGEYKIYQVIAPRR